MICPICDAEAKITKRRSPVHVPMAEEIGCALVITHRGSVVADKFDYRIAVEYDGNYSTLGELEKL